MGEYAIRKSDGQDIKIGTCEEMYYLRYEDRHKVTPMSGSLDPVKCANELRFRLPFPDEDGLRPGEYSDYHRGERLYRASSVQGCSEDFTAPDSDPGSIQLRHECGLLINVPCYHGNKLPEVTKPMGVFWNGKSWFVELCQLRPTPQGVKPILRCRHCGEKWRYDWADIWEYVPGDALRAALRPYMEAEAKLKATE